MAAYSRVNPQVAYNYSTDYSYWGTGNSASNQLYFISTQSSATDICLPPTEGTFYIQDVASNLYVTAAANGMLSATTSVSSLGTKFQLAIVPGGGTIKALSNNQFVTAAPNGDVPLYANRIEAKGYELFRWKVQPGNTYQLTAVVNRATVSTAAGNSNLINNPTSAASTYRLVLVDNSPLPATGRLQNKQSTKYVVATSTDPTLRATATTSATGTVFSFDKLQSPVTDPAYYTIKSLTTGQFVTALPDGTAPLQANRVNAAGWESFKIVPYQGRFIIVHVASGKVTALQADNTLINNSNGSGDQALWAIV